MAFDFQNFGIGLAAGWVSAYGVYRARHLIRSAVDSATAQASTAQNYATQTADRRYINNIKRVAERGHLAGQFIPLTQIIIEPRFIPPAPLATPPEDDVIHSVFHIVPRIPDYPDLLAQYNVETLSIDDLSTGSNTLAILGQPGSGRTTALWAIMLRALGEFPVPKLTDKVQQRIDAEDAALDEKQRTVRIKERLSLEQRAKERLAEEQGRAFDTASENVPLFNRLMPVYVHLADIKVREGEFGSEIDPAEPLVRAVQRQLGNIASKAIPTNLYKRLNDGQVLLLIDGYDDVLEAERPRLIAWLEALLSVHGDNFFIIAGPATGYGSLTNRLGLTPVFLRPWSDRDMETVADRWAAAWPQFGKTRRNRLTAARLDSSAIERAKTNNRGLSPFDLTLKIWANYANDAQVSGFEGWLRTLVGRHLPANQALDAVLPQLAQAGSLQLNEGYVTEKTLTAIMTGLPVRASADETDEPDITPESKKKADAKKPQTEQGKLLHALKSNNMLIEYSSGRYQFRHAFVAAYLASLTLKDVSNEELVSKSRNSAWSQATAYAALQRPIDDVVRVRLNAPPDILNEAILEISRWIPYAGNDATWRVPYLKNLVGLLTAPSQFPLVRERTAAALVTSHDKTVLPVFRKALRNASDPHLRRIACLALGALGDVESINALVPLLEDEENDVQLAAALALGAIRTEQALTALVQALTEGSELLRQAIAETFADIPEEGYPVLYDAVQDEEMPLRRAAIFGLKRIPATWSLIAIYRSFLEDQQWYVRSAAQLAFQELQTANQRGPKRYPPADSIEWLQVWATKRGENIPTGAGANQMLLRALQEGEAAIPTYAASNLGQLGLVAMTKPLYARLADRETAVRDNAYRALAELQLQIGKPLPAPI